QQNKFRFIHVSTMSYQKDPESIIRVAKQLWDEGFEFELVMIGCINESIKRLANKLLLTDEQIIFKGEIPYSQVAVEMQKSSAFILFSRIENLPCVILEALCCGLPVISSDVGGIKEVVNESNGILVAEQNETALKEAMKKMILHYTSFNRQIIAENAALKFNYAEVGKEIDNVYRNITK
ncbi:MAG: glycosyltransferase family 4 protein, partial [Chitinophagaceae bacterium]